MIKTKKTNGYTLAEILIALGVVGVIAVILLGVLNKEHQSRDKAIYLKTSMRLSTIVDTLTNDDIAYPNKDKREDPKYIYTESLFYNTYIDTKYANKWKILEGENNSKLCRLIAEKGYRVDGSNCSDANTNIPAYSSALPVSFSTSDGADFYVYTQRTAVNGTTPLNVQGKYVVPYKTIVYVDVNGKDKGDNCIFNRQSCINPDVHKFLIQADGQIYPMDQMGMYYTQTSKDMKKHEFTEQKDKDTLDKINALLSKDDIDKKEDNAKAYIRPIVGIDEGGVENIGSPTPPKEGALYDIINYNGPAEDEEEDEDDIVEDPPIPTMVSPIPTEVPFLCDSVSCQYDCSKSSLGSGYGSAPPLGTKCIMYKEDRTGTQQEAENYCKSRGLVLPSYHQLSAAAAYTDLLGLTKYVNYWGAGLKSDGSARNCYVPGGNCGTHSPNDIQHYRCMEPEGSIPQNDITPKQWQKPELIIDKGLIPYYDSESDFPSNSDSGSNTSTGNIGAGTGNGGGGAKNFNVDAVDRLLDDYNLDNSPEGRNNSLQRLLK